jgi:hypothetical protein
MMPVQIIAILRRTEAARHDQVDTDYLLRVLHFGTSSRPPGYANQ